MKALSLFGVILFGCCGTAAAVVCALDPNLPYACLAGTLYGICGVAVMDYRKALRDEDHI